jgi:AraC-like DNA-binding protein
MLFRLIMAGSGSRTAPWSTGWRTLPFTLVESAHGGTWILELEGGRSHRIEPGGAFVVPGQVRHRLTVTDRERLHSVWIVAAFEQFPGCPVFRPSPVVTRLSRTDAAPLRRHLRALVDLEGRHRPADLARRQQHGYAALAHLLDTSPAGDQRDPADLQRMQPVIEFIEQHMHEPLTRDRLATVAGLSPTRFHYVFKETVGVAPMHYLQQTRMRRAQELLISNSLSGKSVGAQCGFSTAMYFCRLFRKTHGITPLAYRNRWNCYRSK